ncbi:HPr family phosphocarrier protein [Psychromicrobium xiongbiense]|uniref:HPr family phosphocarrier protein n=1 Tax=Psychromicrobium xiongbiense TaxID=3051184 RepID=UPI003075B47C
MRQTVIGSAIGLHARPAAEFVRAVTQTALPVRIRAVQEPTDGSRPREADARSLLEVMTADFAHGDAVYLSVDDAELVGVQQQDQSAIGLMLEELGTFLSEQN